LRLDRPTVVEGDLVAKKVILLVEDTPDDELR
jgi:hypothetical protein